MLSVAVVSTLEVISPGNFKRAFATDGRNTPTTAKTAKNPPDIASDKIIAHYISFVNINLSKINKFYKT